MKIPYALILSAFILMPSANLTGKDLNHIPDLEVRLSLKEPGNKAETFLIDGSQDKDLPVSVTTGITETDRVKIISVTLTAREKVFCNIGLSLDSGFSTGECDFYLPGFWYHKNLRSPVQAASFHTSKSWNFREDRLSCPLTGVFNLEDGRFISVLRKIDGPQADALTSNDRGEMILSGDCSIGYAGFDNESGSAKLTFGWPYIETPTRQTRKRQLTPPIYTFIRMEPGETRTVEWIVREGKADGYGEFVASTWDWCYDTMKPEPICARFTAEETKELFAKFFRHSFVDRYPLAYNSGFGTHRDVCDPTNTIEIGFCGRTLLNAFNELEYGEQTGQQDLVDMGNAVFDSYLKNGFTPEGWFYEFVRDISEGLPENETKTIRRESEAVYATLLYLKYEKDHGRKHPEWEGRIKHLLDKMVSLVKDDGHMARKFDVKGNDVDPAGGSTPSATSTFVMGWLYFKDARYLQAARKTVDYLEREIISKTDYFSSTLDNDCEDKEAAIAAVTATYYLANVTVGAEREHYIDLCHKAAYFALSWYFMWDVPFAPGQLFGELGFHTVGLGNVSVENNCVDVFVFELGHIVKWLGEIRHEPRFVAFHDVILNSLNQLIPTGDRLCGMAREGYEPEYMQQTDWNYSSTMNGKGFLTPYFAPGWAVASIWEAYSPERTRGFLGGKF